MSFSLLDRVQVLLSFDIEIGAPRFQRDVIVRQLRLQHRDLAAISLLLRQQPLNVGPFENQSLGVGRERSATLLQRLKLLVQFARRASIGGVPCLPQSLVTGILFIEFSSRCVRREAKLFVFSSQLSLHTIRIDFAFANPRRLSLKLFRLASQLFCTLLQFHLLFADVTPFGRERINAFGGLVRSGGTIV